MRAILVCLLFAGTASTAVAQIFEEDPTTGHLLVERDLDARGWASVVVKLNVPEYQPEGRLKGRAARGEQRASIRAVQNDLIADLDQRHVRVMRQYNMLPYLALEVTRSGLAGLKSNPLVSLITADLAGRPIVSLESEILSASLDDVPLLPPATPMPVPMDTSRLVVGADVANANGCDGNGWAVAILDSGVDLDHGAFSGRITHEACYSSNGAAKSSLCPGGVTETTAAGSGDDCRVCTSPGQTIAECDFQPPGQRACPHGSLVAGAAAGNGMDGGGTLIEGVAPEADIISIRVFTRADTTMAACDGNIWKFGCAWVYASDLMKGIERVAELADSVKIAAINISVDMTATEGAPGFGTGFSTPCDGIAGLSGIKDAIDLTNSYGIPSVAATGNQNNSNRINPPACLTNTISVGYTQDGSLHVRNDGPHPTVQDAIGHDTNSDDFLDFWAPGEWITTAWPDNSSSTERGSSVAAPQVSAALAALRSKVGTRGLGYYKNLLIDTGFPVTDTRPANDFTKPRIDVGAACLAMSAVEVTAAVLLEGPYAGGGMMSIGAILQDSLPNHQPFGDPEYDGTVLEYDSTDAVPSLPPDVVDWVELELRTATDASSTVAKRPALLLTDGSVVDYDGVSPVRFLGVDSLRYYLVVRHRNHGDVMSASKLNTGDGVGSWNFTTAMSKAYTTGPDPMKEVDSRFVMFGGDINIDAQITASDFNEWLVQTKAVLEGYRSGDITLDGQVTTADFNIWLPNTKAVRTSQVPN